MQCQGFDLFYCFKPNMYYDILSMTFSSFSSSPLFLYTWHHFENNPKSANVKESTVKKSPPKQLFKNVGNLETAAPRDTLLHLSQRQNMDKRQVVVYREVYGKLPKGLTNLSLCSLGKTQFCISQDTQKKHTHTFCIIVLMLQTLLWTVISHMQNLILNVLTQKCTENKPSKLCLYVWVCNLLHLYKSGQGDYKGV